VIRHSLRWRLLLAAAAAILVALAISWVFMTLLFERHLERRLEAEMTRDALGLVSDLAFDLQGGLQLEGEPSDPRLRKPAGGYYWQVSTPAGVLRSRSLWDSALPVATDAPTGSWRLRHARGPFAQSVAVLERQVVVDVDHPPVVVQFAQDQAPLADARGEFGRELGLFLSGLGLVLLGAAWLQVRVGLRPLDRIRGDLERLARSSDARLPAARLREVQPLVGAINALAEARHKDLAQARRRAADLAHGLKTPLAALAAQSRRAREAGATSAAEGMDQAIAAVTLVVEGELARARVQRLGGVRGTTANVLEVVDRLVTVLEHTDKGEALAFDVAVPDGLGLAVGEEHLAEMLGALMENAVRHALRQVRITATAGPGWTRLTVEDDGPGMLPSRMEAALEGNPRVDESAGGSGLGLLIARDLARSTHGTLALGSSSLGGLRVALEWGGPDEASVAR
jgi:signal transduction histidine kinase